jgi:rod shape-determining protein MreC
MESLITRYRNVSVLVAILFAQVLGLAVQVRRPSENESSTLIRIWAVSAVTPFEKAIVWVQHNTSTLWRNYVYLRGVRQENRDLKYEIQNLRLEQVRLKQDAEQARRLQVLLGFKQRYISKTVAAQVIGFSGSELSRAIYIDKGERDGVERDMAVITADGVVGKILRSYNSTSLVLLINDQTSGVGVVLEKSRLQGILQGTPTGQVMLQNILSDDQVDPGEEIVTSGGDQIFPKGLAVATVVNVSRNADSFLKIRARPAADLSKLEEVLVITQQVEKMPQVDTSTPKRAIDIMARRLPSVPDKPAATAVKPKTEAHAQAPVTVTEPKTEPKTEAAAGAGSRPPVEKTIEKTAISADGTPARKPAGAAAPGAPAMSQEATPAVVQPVHTTTRPNAPVRPAPQPAQGEPASTPPEGPPQ